MIFQANQIQQDKISVRNDDGLTLLYSKSKRHPTGFPTRDYPIWNTLKETIPKSDKEEGLRYGDTFYYKRLAGMMTSIAKLLDEQTSETIDDFIAMNPDSAGIVKLAIACVFYRILYPETKSNIALRKPLRLRHLEQDNDNPKRASSRRNWIHLLINIVRHAVYNETLQDKQKIRIINFNYDGILESVLDSQFGNTAYAFKPWQNYIEILHPHGWMGDLPETCSDMQSTIEVWASAINVVNENKPSQAVTNARQIASKWIGQADKIYMAGFALSAPNAKMLGLGRFGRLREQDWYIHNYDGSSGLKQLAQFHEGEFKTLGTYNLNEGGRPIHIYFEGGTRDDPMTIANWFQIGVPGEMPG